MSARSRRPPADPPTDTIDDMIGDTTGDTTDDRRTEIYDPTMPRGPAGVRGSVLPTPTELTKVERKRPATTKRPPIPSNPPPPGPAPFVAPPPPVAPPARSAPLKIISMKDQAEQTDKLARKLPAVQIRSISSVTPTRHATPPHGMGNLAPPRDPREVRSRRVRDNVIWGCLAVILACGVTLAIWFLAR